MSGAEPGRSGPQRLPGGDDGDQAGVGVADGRDRTVIWLNGAFGVGKTTVAEELRRLIPAARFVDPERIGYVMRRTLWRGADYQDVALWRRLTLYQVARASRTGPVIVPMTIVRPDVYDELTAGAHTFLLTASRPSLEQRIGGSDEARRWRRDNLDRCLDAFESGAFGDPVDTDGQAPEDVARLILERLPQQLHPGG